MTSTQRHESQLNTKITPEYNLSSSSTIFQKPMVSHTESTDFSEPEVREWATPEVIQRVGKEFGKENSLNVLLNSTKDDWSSIYSSNFIR